MQVILFQIKDQLHGIDLKDVREVITIPKITKLPDSKIEGIINIRGQIVPIVNLA